ncbi:putative oxidoreductase [Helianthus annuus]|nr:putative oxidoreductase [Helianthus annuus]
MELFGHNQALFKVDYFYFIVISYTFLKSENVIEIKLNCHYFVDVDIAFQGVVARIYHIYYEGCLMNFEIGEGGEEASKLYPDVRYTRVHEYLQRDL